MASELRHRAAGSGVDSGAYKLRLQYPGSDPTVIQCLVDPDQKVQQQYKVCSLRRLHQQLFRLCCAQPAGILPTKVCKDPPFLQPFRYSYSHCSGISPTRRQQPDTRSSGGQE